MAIRVIRAADPVAITQITACIYAYPAAGKTSLGFSARNPLLIDFDIGAYRAVSRGDYMAPRTWDEVAAITEADLEPFDTIVIDTVGQALVMLEAHIVKREPKLREPKMSLQKFGRLKTEFAAWMAFIRRTGKDVVMLAHMDEQRSGDELLERLHVTGGSKNEIHRLSDIMGRIVRIDGKRSVSFLQTDAAFAKAPPGLDTFPIPDRKPGDGPGDCLARILHDAKASINAIGEEGRRRWLAQEAQRAEWAEAEVSVLTDAARAGGLDAGLKRILADIAKARGLSWDKDAREWRGIDAAEEAAP